MKILSKIILPMLFLAFMFTNVSESNAQCTGTQVQSNFVSPHSAADMAHNVKGCAPGSIVEFSLCTFANNLCPGYGATAEVYVDGVMVDQGDISNVGDSIEFEAPCGSNIYILVTSYSNITNYNSCDAIQLVSFGLYEQ